MSIVAALHKEAEKLNRQLTAIRAAIQALNGNHSGTQSRTGATASSSPRKTMSAAVRARISQKAKARWAKIKAEQSKGKSEQSKSKAAK